MSKKSPRLLKALRTADDICKLTTGRRLNEVVARTIELFGQDFINKQSNDQANAAELLELKMPYIILGINPEAPDVVVRAAYRAMMKDCHPDTQNPDTEKASRINTAYEAICKQRGIPK
jgi:DnaJ-domain-containing protein 1